VSGDGKGIAAECALALARETGCRLGVFGRSERDRDAELRANLERFEAAGVRVAYVPADVSDPRAVRRAVATIEEDLGPVTGLLHGAGMNEPRPLVQLDESDFGRTLSPKLGGLDNLLSALDDRSLRCAIGFGSILAELGLPGEADYAWANERLSRRLEAFARAHPETVCLSLEWSLWSGVGMGERLGRVEILASQNITAISPDEGVESLLGLLRRTDLPVRVVLTGRFGVASHPGRGGARSAGAKVPGAGSRVHARNRADFRCPALLRVRSPSRRSRLSRQCPGAGGEMALEAMAQVAMALTGETRRPHFEHVAFRHPAEVPRGEKRTLRVAGLVRSPGCVAVAIRSDATDFLVDHVTAELRFDTALDVGERRPAPSAPALELDPARELYGDLFFHRGRFARVRAYHSLHTTSCTVRIERRDEPFFGAFEPQSLELGDPGARDAVIHAIQACVPDRDLLPVGVDRIEFSARPSVGDTVLRAVERSRREGSYLYDLEVVDAEGDPVERWTGLELVQVSASTERAVWPPALLAPHLEALAHEACPGLDLRAAIVSGTSREASERAAQIAGGECALRRRPDGKPFLDSGHPVSASHAAGHTLAIVGSRSSACDMESVMPRSAELWRDLLLGRHGLAERLAQERGESLDVAATRVFGAAECLRKAGLQRETPLVPGGSPDADVVRLSAAGVDVLSLLVRFVAAEHPLVVSLLVTEP
jgi:enediyne polyketide synthase